MENARLLSTTSAQPSDAAVMSYLEDLHHRIEEISTGTAWKIIRNYPTDFGWESGDEYVHIDCDVDAKALNSGRYNISIVYENHDDDANNISLEIPSYPIPLPYTNDDGLREWAGNLAKNIRIVMDAYGRIPVKFDEFSVEKSAYDAAMAIAFDINERTKKANPEYFSRYPEWKIKFPLPWNDGEISNCGYSIPFSQIYPETVNLSVIKSGSSHMPSLTVSPFEIERSGKVCEDPLTRLTVVRALEQITDFFRPKDVAKNKSSD